MEKTIDEMEIGEDVPQLTAKTVLVEDFKLEPVRKDGKEIGNKLILICKHPDKDETIEISSAKVQFNEKLRFSGLWVKPQDGMLPFNSAIAKLLRKKNHKKIMDLKGDQLETVLDESGYLAIMAY